MDWHLKQWKRHQQQEDESEDPHTPSAKFPKLLLPPHPQQVHNNNDDDDKDHLPPLSSKSSSGSTLPLFVPDHFPHQPSNSSSSSSPPSMIGMGSYFSLAQWKELELQALIYRYMFSGTEIPPELLHPIKNSLAHLPPSFLQQNHPRLSYLLHHPHSQPFRFQSGYLGGASMDPEPGRCRRTDGKKWRCSRDVVPGQKYCERHVHRGRNRSRKPVEISPLPRTCAVAAAADTATNSTNVVASLGSVASESHLGITGSSQRPLDLFQMNKSHSGPIIGARAKPSGSQVLRHFFDDWPRTLQEPDVRSLTGLAVYCRESLV